MKHTLLFSFCLFFAYLPSAFNQKTILGGSLHIEQLENYNSNEVRATAIIYLNYAPVSTIPDSVNIQWGDGVSTKIGITSNILLPGQLARLTYSGDYSYASLGKYNISLEDCCLSEAFVNYDASPPVPLKISAVFSLLNGQFQGYNSTAQLLSPLVGSTFLNQSYSFNPVAIDTNDDSLAYSLFNPMAEFNYHFPDEIMPTSMSDFDINQQNGTITWDKPTKAGDYLVGLKVDEFRHQVLISESYHLLDIRAFDFEIALFPNPTDSDLTLNISPAVSEEELKVRIYNALGQLVLEQAAVFTSTGHTINVQDFANGVYLLEVEALGRTWVKKFVKR